jgi:hypothetical protein
MLAVYVSWISYMSYSSNFWDESTSSRNVGEILLDYILLRLRRQRISQLPLWDPQIQRNHIDFNIYLWLYSSFVGPWPLFRFLNLYIVGSTPWKGDQPVARPLPTHRTTQTQNKCKQTSMPWVGFEPTIPEFERAKTVHALDHAATVGHRLRNSVPKVPACFGEIGWISNTFFNDRIICIFLYWIYYWFKKKCHTQFITCNYFVPHVSHQCLQIANLSAALRNTYASISGVIIGTASPMRFRRPGKSWMFLRYATDFMKSQTMKV